MTNEELLKVSKVTAKLWELELTHFAGDFCPTDYGGDHGPPSGRLFYSISCPGKVFIACEKHADQFKVGGWKEVL
jgi:hypothetical protein